MDMLKTGWNFFQNEVLGMAWLNRLIGNLINACGLDATSKIGDSIQFFVYDTIKIMVLLPSLFDFLRYIIYRLRSLFLSSKHSSSLVHTAAASITTELTAMYMVVTVIPAAISLPIFHTRQSLQHMFSNSLWVIVIRFTN